MNSEADVVGIIFENLIAISAPHWFDAEVYGLPTRISSYTIVAQWLEHRAFDPLVAGSSPVDGNASRLLPIAVFC